VQKHTTSLNSGLWAHTSASRNHSCRHCILTNFIYPHSIQNSWSFSPPRGLSHNPGVSGSWDKPLGWLRTSRCVIHCVQGLKSIFIRYGHTLHQTHACVRKLSTSRNHACQKIQNVRKCNPHGTAGPFPLQEACHITQGCLDPGTSLLGGYRLAVA